MPFQGVERIHFGIPGRRSALPWAEILLPHSGRKTLDAVISRASSTLSSGVVGKPGWPEFFQLRMVNLQNSHEFCYKSWYAFFLFFAPGLGLPVHYLLMSGAK